jgi:hypothetical protein
MKDTLINLTYEIELRPGEKLALPQAVIDSIGPGRWLINIRPAVPCSPFPSGRDHCAFLNSYVPEDEGLYDADSSR